MWQGGEGALMLDWCGERWWLLADRAVVRERVGWLIITDPHFGKSAAFRAAGINCPEPIERDLQRLDALIEEVEPARLVVLGDLLHSRSSLSDAVVEQVARWRAKHSGMPWTLIRGNHDRAAGDPPGAWAIETRDEGAVGDGVGLNHEAPAPRASTGLATPMLCGHVHPAVVLPDAGRTAVRLPCFLVSPERMMLPAFGSFTGMHSVRPADDERVYVASPGGVFALPPHRVRGRTSRR